RLHAIMALAAGVVVATAVADLLPEAFQLAGDDHVLEVGVAAVVGFIGFSLIEAFLHQWSFEHAGSHDHAHDDAHDHAGEAGHDHDATRSAAMAQPRGHGGPPTLLGIL